jgi:hypothetical protein
LIFFQAKHSLSLNYPARTIESFEFGAEEEDTPTEQLGMALRAKEQEVAVGGQVPIRSLRISLPLVRRSSEGAPNLIDLCDQCIERIIAIE